jgi:hypothetical protein
MSKSVTLRVGAVDNEGISIVDPPPYEQQGQPLDPSLGVNGEWVIYEFIFLFLPPPEQNLMQLSLPDGKVCLGFNAAHLARGLEMMHPSDLLLNNRIRSLSVRFEPGVLGRGATRTTDYIFELPSGIGIRAPVSSFSIAGSA